MSLDPSVRAIVLFGASSPGSIRVDVSNGSPSSSSKACATLCAGTRRPMLSCPPAEAAATLGARGTITVTGPGGVVVPVKDPGRMTQTFTNGGKEYVEDVPALHDAVVAAASALATVQERAPGGDPRAAEAARLALRAEPTDKIVVDLYGDLSDDRSTTGIFESVSTPFGTGLADPEAPARDEVSLRERQAETREQAQDAAELVMVDYEELPCVVDPRQAIEPGTDFGVLTTFEAETDYLRLREEWRGAVEHHRDRVLGPGESRHHRAELELERVGDLLEHNRRAPRLEVSGVLEGELARIAVELVAKGISEREGGRIGEVEVQNARRHHRRGGGEHAGEEKGEDVFHRKKGGGGEGSIARVAADVVTWVCVWGDFPGVVGGVLGDAGLLSAVGSTVAQVVSGAAAVPGAPAWAGDFLRAPVGSARRSGSRNSTGCCRR